MLKPVGYYILIEMEIVENKTESGIIIASQKENEREQNGHDVGVIKALGPNAFVGFQGIDDKDEVNKRAADYGVKIGDKIEFNRYDGKVPRDPEYKYHRLIQDQHIVGVYE